MPLSVSGKNLFTRKSQLGGGSGETASSLDIDGLDDIGADIADADLLIIDDGGGGTNRKSAVTRIPTYVFTALSLDEDAMGSDSATKFATQQSIKAYIDAKSVTVSDGSSSTAIALGATMTFAGTSNGVTVSESSGTVTIGLPDDVTIVGDLVVNGDTVTVNTATLSVEDPLILLGNGNGADSVDLGLYAKFTDSGVKYSGLFRDASDSDKWKLFATTGNSHEAPTTTVNTTSGFTLGTLVVDSLEGTITTAAQTNITSIGTIATGTWEATDIAVAHGGTGASTLTDGGVLLGSGTGAVTAMAVLADGELIVGDGTADPVAESGATLRTSIGVGTGDSPQFTGIELGHASDTTIVRASSGDITIEGNAVYRAGGTDVPVADGGTGVSTLTANGVLIGNGTSAIASVDMSTKGHLLIGDGSGNPSMLAIGTNDYILTADSGEATGVKWAAAASGGMTAWILEDDDGTEVSISNAEEVKFIGAGITTNWTDVTPGSDGDPFDLTFTVDAAQTGITSIYATDLILGEDAETAIDFGTVNEIDFKADNAARLTLSASAFYPVTNNQIDLGTSSLEFKDAFFDGTVTAGNVTGNITGNVTGNASGTAATVTTAAQSNITSLGTLTALTVDDVAIDGKVMTMTGSSSDTAVFTAGTNGTLSIVTTDAAAAAANIQITADGTVDIDSAGVLTLDSGAAINIEPASGSAILLDGTISVDAGVVTGATSITSTAFVGDITGNVTGNASGTAATVTTAAQSAITSLGTLTALTVDDVAVDGKVITMTGSASDTIVMTAGTNGTLSIVTTDAAAAAANIQITADGTVDIDSAGVLTLDSGAAINIEPASGSAILLDGTISIDAGVVTGATSITSTAFVGDITGDVTGNASGTAATVTTAAQTNITSLGTLTALTVDDVAVDGKVITMTGSSSDTAVMTVGTNGTLSIVTTDAAAAAANIQISADGTAEMAGTTVTLDSAGAVVLDSATGIINIQDAGSTVLSITEGNSGDVTIQLETNAKDLIFSDNGDAVNMKILDAAAGINVPGEVQTTGIGYTDGDNAIVIADGGSTTFPQQLSLTKNIALTNIAGTTDGDYSGITAVFVAGEALEAGEVVSIHTDGEVYKALATGSTSGAINAAQPAIGVVVADIADGGNAVVLLHGFLCHNANFPTYTVGATLYVPEAETSSKCVAEEAAPDTDGDFIQVIGYAVHANRIFVSPDLTVIESA